MKDQKFLSVVGGLALLTFGLFSGSASAASVDVSADESVPGQVTFSVTGSDFPAGETTGGDWVASWDDSILQYVGTTWIDNSNAWFLKTVNVDDVANGNLRVDGIVNCFAPACVAGNGDAIGPNFAIVDILFNVLVAAPSTLQLAASVTGWTIVEDSAIIPGVTYGSASVGAPVPVPAAAWLFGSALGMLAWVRRRTAA